MIYFELLPREVLLEIFANIDLKDIQELRLIYIFELTDNEYHTLVKLKHYLFYDHVKQFVKELHVEWPNAYRILEEINLKLTLDNVPNWSNANPLNKDLIKAFIIMEIYFAMIIFSKYPVIYNLVFTDFKKMHILWRDFYNFTEGASNYDFVEIIVEKLSTSTVIPFLGLLRFYDLIKKEGYLYYHEIANSITPDPNTYEKPLEKVRAWRHMFPRMNTHKYPPELLRYPDYIIYMKSPEPTFKQVQDNLKYLLI